MNKYTYCIVTDDGQSREIAVYAPTEEQAQLMAESMGKQLSQTSDGFYVGLAESEELTGDSWDAFQQALQRESAPVAGSACVAVEDVSNE